MYNPSFKTTLIINGHSETMLLFVTSLAYFDIVLGLPWLESHNPEINWKEGNICFNSPSCRKHSTDYPTTISSISREAINERRQKKNILDYTKISAVSEECDVHSFKE